MTWPIIFLFIMVAIGIFLPLRQPWKNSLSSTPEASHTQESYTLEASEELTPELSPDFEVSEDLTSTPVQLSFATSVLHVMSRCPKSLYVYWNFVQGEFPMQNFLEHYPPGSRAILRLYELADQRTGTDNIRHAFDTPIDLSTDNIYLHVPYPNVSYFLELGVLTPDGMFIVWLRSKDVAMPRESISPIIDPAWAPIFGIQYDSDLSGRALDSTGLIKTSNPLN